VESGIYERYERVFIERVEKKGVNIVKKLKGLYNELCQKQSTFFLQAGLCHPWVKGLRRRLWAFFLKIKATT